MKNSFPNCTRIARSLVSLVLLRNNSRPETTETNHELLELKLQIRMPIQLPMSSIPNSLLPMGKVLKLPCMHATSSNSPKRSR